MREDSNLAKQKRSGAGPRSTDGTSWWARHRLAFLGIVIGVVGVLATIVAWLWPWQPVSPYPPIYFVRVQVLDPDGRPVAGSTVRVSAGNEPQLLPDGWWEVEIPAAKVPRDRKVTIWAEHEGWETERADLVLSEDPNPRVEVRLKAPESRIRGVVVDAGGRGVVDARVTVRDRGGTAAVTDQDGNFELTVAAPKGESVRIHVENSDFPPKDSFCYAGRDGCSLVLEGS